MSAKEEIYIKYKELKHQEAELVFELKRIQDEIDSIDGQISDCVAAARLFGLSLNDSELPDPAPMLPDLVTPELAKLTIREFTLRALKAAYPSSVKARDIKENYENTYGGVLHYKTVGMTLYRLSLEFLVERKGREWKFVPDKEQSTTYQNYKNYSEALK